MPRISQYGEGPDQNSGPPNLDTSPADVWDQEAGAFDHEDEPEPLFTYHNKEGELTVLSERDEAWTVSRISKLFDKLERRKGPVKERWKKTNDVVKGVISYIESERFAGMVPYGQQCWQTLISHIWGRALQTDTILFGVDGKDTQSQINAPIQKESILDAMEADDFREKADRATNEYLMKGIILSHMGYEEKSRKIQVLSGHMGTPIQYEKDEEGNDTDEIAFVDIDQPIKQGPSLTIIDPYHFVFDTTNWQKWDQCFKAYQRYEEFEDIAANPNFKNWEDLEVIAKPAQNATLSSYIGRQTKKKTQTFEEGIDDQGRIELIEFHGDFRLKDGSYLRNWTMVIAARKKLIRFEENPLKINPFRRHVYEETEDGWGATPLDYLVSIVQGASTLFNTGIEAAKMAINPPMYAPKGMLPQRRYYLGEGKVIEYTPDPTEPTRMPTPFPLNPQAPFPYVAQLEQQSESVTGATRQLSGNVTGNDKEQTATEFQGLQIVGNLVLDRVVDRYNKFWKIPVIEQYAIIQMMFNPVKKTVKILNSRGLPQYADVTPDVYYGNYKYKIVDNKSEIERKQHINEKLQFFTMLLNNPMVNPKLKIVDMLTAFCNDLGYDSGGSWFMSPDEIVAQQTQDAMTAAKIQLMHEQIQATIQPAPNPELPNAPPGMPPGGLPVGSPMPPGPVLPNHGGPMPVPPPQGPPHGAPPPQHIGRLPVPMGAPGAPPVQTR